MGSLLMATEPGVRLTAVAAGTGLIMTFNTASETLPALSAFNPSMLVSNARSSGLDAAWILVMMTSSDSPSATMSMTSWLVMRCDIC